MSSAFRTLRWMIVVPVLCGVLEAEGQSGRVYRDRVQPHWFAQNTKFWYRVDLKDGAKEFNVIDVETGSRSAAFDHQKAALEFSRVTGDTVLPAQLPVESLEFDLNHNTVLLQGRAGRFTWDPQNQTLRRLDAANASAAAGMPLFLPPRPSAGGGADTEIVVTNSLDQPVQLIWNNPAGQRQLYESIAPGTTHRQHTFAGHVWLMAYAADTLEDSRPIGCLQATDAPIEIRLDTDILAKIERRDLRTNRPRRAGPGRSSLRSTSPDETFEAFVRDNNLWLRSTAEGTEQPLTEDATASHTFRRDHSRQRLVGLAYDLEDAPAEQPAVHWSPDGTRLIALQTHTVPERRVYYVESSPRDDLHPQLQSYPYLKAGDPIPVSRPRLFCMPDGREIPVSQELFPNPWELRFVRFSEDGQLCYWLYNERGHQTLRILEMNLATGDVRAIVDEHSDTFIHYSSGGKLEMHWLTDQTLLWASERSGWNHLYRCDLAKGEVRNAVTSGDWNVRSIEHIDEAAQVVWFYAVGIRPEQDPYHQHFCRANLDGTGLTVLTEGDGTHQIEWSPDQQSFIDRYSRVDLPAVTELRAADDGRLICQVEVADASEILAQRHSFPEPFMAKGRDGSTDIWGIIHRPKDFDPSKKYPVIENIYAGPHDQHVPKSFRAAWGHQQTIANAGFIVVQIDGMGTAWRSKAFHDVCFQNLKDAGFPDRIAWMKAAAARYPQLDLSRVGIYGGSAGGQNAMAALLWHGDFYQAAVADCGCHDNRMDKIWWNEQWMGYPAGKHYEANSNKEHAHQLQGHLMLVVGELDRNVDPATTTQVVGQLIKANKEFDFLLVVGAGHGACETPWAAARRLQFFQRHLNSQANLKVERTP